MKTRIKNPQSKTPLWLKILLLPFMITGALLFLLLMLIMAIIQIPANTKDFFKDKAFLKKLKQLNRIESFDTISEKLNQGKGSLIVEWTLYGPGDLWWIDQTFRTSNNETLPLSLTEVDLSLSNEIFEILFNHNTDHWIKQNTMNLKEKAILVERKKLMKKYNSQLKNLPKNSVFITKASITWLVESHILKT